MAKMFYTLEEAAQKLGMNEDAVKRLADEGKLQQFRDRDKLMFKREQVDSMSKSGSSGTGEFSLVDDEETVVKIDAPKGPKPGNKTDAIDLDLETNKLDRGGKGASATGISVFEADEVGGADPMAQTQITGGFGGGGAVDEELTLDSVGSGSGLLDLTRESDDTSLGAVELLDDMGPGGTRAGEGPTVTASSGIFDAAGGAESGASNMADLDEGAGYAMMPMEAEDPAGDGFGGGVLLGVFAVLVIAAMIVLSGINDSMIGLTRTLASGHASMGMWYWVAGIVCLVLGGAGYALGKARA